MESGAAKHKSWRCDWSSSCTCPMSGLVLLINVQLQGGERSGTPLVFLIPKNENPMEFPAPPYPSCFLAASNDGVFLTNHALRYCMRARASRKRSVVEVCSGRISVKSILAILWHYPNFARRYLNLVLPTRLNLI